MQMKLTVCWDRYFEEEMLSYFPMLELKYDAETKTITVPTFRRLLRPCDIAEEVRFYGYDKFYDTSFRGSYRKLSFKLRIEEIARRQHIAVLTGYDILIRKSKVMDKPLHQRIQTLERLLQFQIRLEKISVL